MPGVISRLLLAGGRTDHGQLSSDRDIRHYRRVCQPSSIVSDNNELTSLRGFWKFSSFRKGMTGEGFGMVGHCRAMFRLHYAPAVSVKLHPFFSP